MDNEVKKAIRYLKSIKNCNYIIALLQRDGKFEAIVNDIEKGTLGFKDYDFDQVFFDKHGKRFAKIINRLKNKYLLMEDKP